MKNVSVFAMYLPQYHATRENSQFWGEGFTDWVSVKKATPLFEGHVQPKAPQNDFYYDLSQKSDILWQAKKAKECGISGLGIYHYWFNTEQQALTKPAEIILENKDIDIPFFFAWDNASWKRTWSKIKGNDWSPLMDGKNTAAPKGPEVLIEYRLGGEKEWKIHFEYLLPYFKDERYVKDDNRPVFMIYNFGEGILDMVKYWDALAVENGFDGVKVIFSYNPFHGIPVDAYKFRYEPLYSGWGSLLDRACRLFFKKKVQKKVLCYSYDKVWKKILGNARRCRDEKMYYGAFVNYDDTPRRGNRGKAVIGSTPEKFAKYLSKLIDICKRQNKKYIFLTAWNEWGEGAYMEPDKQYGNQYADAFAKVAKF